MKPGLASLIVALVAPLWPGAVSASGNGSPICHVDQIIGCPMGFPVPDAAGIFTVQVMPGGYTPGQALTVTVYPSVTFSRLNGLLLYIEAPDQIGGDSYPVKIGSFAPTLPVGLKFGCGAGTTSGVVTHDGGVDVMLPIQLTWTPPLDASGRLRLRAIVLRAGNLYDWQDAPYEMFSIELPLDPVFTDSFE